MTLPVMTISCSSAVCECQGTTHPGGAFKIKVERPVFRSRVSIGDMKDFTSGWGSNFMEASGLMSPAGSSAPIAALLIQAIRTAIVQYPYLIISFPFVAPRDGFNRLPAIFRMEK